MGIGVRYQRQIADALFRLYVRYVAYPYLVGPVRDNLFDKVRIFPVVVGRVRCLITASPADADHQTVLPQDLDERIASRHAARLLEQRADNHVQLHAAEAGVVFPVITGLLDDQRFYRILGKVVLLVLVEGLPAITKQPAESPQRRLRGTSAQQGYCLVPDFFLIGMLKVSSATSIIVS